VFWDIVGSGSATFSSPAAGIDHWVLHLDARLVG
jgi:hypothetical protein